MRDEESDKKAGKNTVVVKKGGEWAKKYHYFLVISAMVLVLVFAFLNHFHFDQDIFVVAYFPMIGHLITVYKNQNPKLLDPELKKLAISTFLLVNPNVLLGLPFINHHIIESKLQNGQVLKYPFIAEDYSKEISSIITYFKENEPYLNKGVNISQISVATGIPVKQLSFIMNNHFKQRFNDFINQHRIEYITKKINQGYLDHYTLQTLSSEAGFSSPTTFIAAFKKIELCSPSEYLINRKR
jgi:AraC-like DNA-binding protein